MPLTVAWKDVPGNADWRLRLAAAHCDDVPVWLLEELWNDLRPEVRRAVVEHRIYGSRFYKRAIWAGDAAVAAVAAERTYDEDLLEAAARRADGIVGLALVGRAMELPDKILLLVAHHPSWYIRSQLARSRWLTETVAEELSRDPDERILSALARNPAVSEPIRVVAALRAAPG
jgi:hypothetical protein